MEEELLHAISVKDISILEELLSQPNVPKNIMLHGAIYAIQMKHYGLVDYFTSYSITIQDILTLAVEKSLIDVIYNLQNLGAHYNFELTNGNTLLSHAALQYSFESMDALLQCGADINRRSTNGNTVLSRIIKEDDTYSQVVRYLMTEGADVNITDSEGLSIYEQSICSGNFNLLQELLIYTKNINHTNNFGVTLLMTACCYQQKKCVDLLISMGADINQQTPVGETALMKIIRYTNLNKTTIDIIQQLLNHGADVNIRDSIHETSFYTAVEFNNIDLINIFLAHKANIIIQNTWNITPFILAIGNGNIDLANQFITRNCLTSVSRNNTHWYSNTSVLNNVVIELTNNNDKTKCKQINLLFFGSGECIPFEELENPHDIAKQVFKQPLEFLQEHARFQIRKYLYKLSPINLISKINMLPIPLVMKHYLYYT